MCPPCVGEPGSLEQAVCVRRVLWVPVFLRSLNSCGAEFISLCHPFDPKVAIYDRAFVDNHPFNQIKVPVRVLQHLLKMQVLIKTDWCSRHVILAQKKRHRVRGESGRCRPIPHFVNTSPISPLERSSAYARGFLTNWKRGNFYRDI